MKDVKVDQKLHFKTCNGGTLVIKTKNYALWVLVGDNKNGVSMASIGHKECVVGKSIEERNKALSWYLKLILYMFLFLSVLW